MLDSASLDVAARGGGMLTDVLRREIPALEVRRTGTPGSCPAFRIRGVKSIMLSSEPQVYVNGVRHVDTCILDAIPPSQILSVQVYGTGQSPPNIGMPSSPGGLIVIYLKN